eukprot:scaffold98642_cov16-Tisochrysis_lutea.AAC.1
MAGDEMVITAAMPGGGACTLLLKVLRGCAVSVTLWEGRAPNCNLPSAGLSVVLPSLGRPMLGMKPLSLAAVDDDVGKEEPRLECWAASEEDRNRGTSSKLSSSSLSSAVDVYALLLCSETSIADDGCIDDGEHSGVVLTSWSNFQKRCVLAQCARWHCVYTMCFKQRIDFSTMCATTQPT